MLEETSEGVSSILTVPSDSLGRRSIDMVIVLLAAPIVLIFSAVVAVILKCSEPKESVFFGITRYGKGGKPFKMWKFRTMRNDYHLLRCEEIIRSFAPELDFKLENDPRISPFGTILRRTHLDELPQLFNMLVGDMTLVGPRPNSLSPQKYEPWQLERLTVRPGLTGPWQIHGKRKVHYSERFAQEIDFIRSRTFLKETSIVFQTVWHCINRRGMI
ncbi:MAG: sugar transferase [Paracoccaceae bacterium]